MGHPAGEDGAAGAVPAHPRPRRRRAVAAVGVAVLLCGTGWVAYNETFLSLPRPAGDRLTVRAQPGVPEQDVAAAVAALHAADRYLTDVLGAQPPARVDLKLATFSRCVPYRPLSATGSAVADADEVCVNTRHAAWPRARQDPRAATVLLAHERFHNVQGQLGCLPSPREHEYAWWVEGSATWVGFAAAVHAGLLTEQAATEELDRWRAGGADEGPLRRYERGIAGDAQYALAAQAVDVLVRRVRPSRLLAFCRAVGGGTTWSTAFEDAFGLTPDELYREVDRTAG